MTEDGTFYYGLAEGMIRAGYSTLDNISIHTYLSDKEVLRKGYERRGGYKTIQDITSLLNADNAPVYYDELIKNNMLLRLHKAGFNVVKDIEKLNQMSSEEVYDFYDFKLNNVCVSKNEKIKAENISEGYEPYIDDWDKGKEVGFKIGYPLLNYKLAGVHRQNMLLHIGGIGQGKTTTAILLYVLPVIKSGENVCIVANEQGCSEFRQMILASVLFNEIKYFGMNRQRLIVGNFTEEQKAKLKEASDWLANCKGKIFFVELNNYALSNVKKIIRKYAKLNVGMFLWDTLKPENDSDERSWGLFSQTAKELFLIAKKENVAIVATAQASAESNGRRYLDLSCIGKSRAIAECASTVTIFRPVYADEKEKLKGYTWQKDDNGKYSKIKKMIDLSEDKDYIVMFIPKNRFGDTAPAILYERNMSFNTLTELGYVDISPDKYKGR